MGLFGIFGMSRRKKELLALQEILTGEPSRKLLTSESQLLRAANMQAQNDLRIINDCVALVSNTIKPDVFFSRLEMLEEKSKHLMQFEPYISFSGALPSQAYREFTKKKSNCIYLFLERYFAALSEKAEGMKTERGKANQYQKFYDSLQRYYPAMNKFHIEFIEEKHRFGLRC